MSGEWQVPDYYNVVKQPMDLQRMRDKCVSNQYELRRHFLE